MSALHTVEVGNIFLVNDGYGGHVFEAYGTMSDAMTAARFHGGQTVIKPLSLRRVVR